MNLTDWFKGQGKLERQKVADDDLLLRRSELGSLPNDQLVIACLRLEEAQIAMHRAAKIKEIVE